MSLKAEEAFVGALGYKNYTFRCIDLNIYVPRDYAHYPGVRLLLSLSPHLLWTGTRLSL